MKLNNTGLMVTYTFTYPNGDVKKFATDGYVIRGVAESICSARTTATVNWSNRMGSIKDPKNYVLSEGASFASEDGYVLDIDSEDVDPQENRYFNTQATVCKELENFCNQL